MSQAHSNPYVGPSAFQDGNPLYGRDRERVRILDLLMAQRIVLLYSPSGAGKTSLIQAALIPALREEEFLVLPIIRVGSSVEPVQDLQSETNPYVLSTLLSLEESSQHKRSMTELANTDLITYLDQRLDEKSEMDEQVLIFDQFEEILTLDPNDQETKKEFFTQLGKALRPRNRWALFAMREEFLAGLDPYLHLIPNQLRTTFRLELLKERAARQAIQRPAQNAGIPFTDEAANRLIGDLSQVWVQQVEGSREKKSGMYIEPVQLQVVCHQLWEKLPSDVQQINEAHVKKFANVDMALARYYASRVRNVAQKTKESEWGIREWFEFQLITEQGFRGQVLMEPDRSQGLDNEAIKFLEEDHLVRREKRLNSTWFELTHDRLIQPIQKNNIKWFRKNEKRITKIADAAYDGLTQNEQEQMRYIFTQLVRVRDPDSYYTGQQVFIETLVSKESNVEETRKLLRRLEAKRLLAIRTLSAEEGENERVEVELAHKALIQHWSQLHRWLDEDLASERLYHGIRQAAQEWKAKGKRDESLLVHRGSRLEEAEKLSENVLSNDFQNDKERIEAKLAKAYLDACVALREREKAEKEEQQQRELQAAQAQHAAEKKAHREAKKRIEEQNKTATRLRLGALALALVLLLAVGAAVFALIQQQKAHENERLATAALAKSYWSNATNAQEAKNWSESAHFLSRFAQEESEPTLIKNAIFNIQNYIKSLFLVYQEKLEGAIHAVAFSNQGYLVFTLSDDGTAQLRHTKNDSPSVQTLEPASPIWGATFSPKGRLILTWSTDGTAQMWRTKDGSPIAQTLKHDGPRRIQSGAFSPDGNSVLTLSDDGTAQLWHTKDGSSAAQTLGAESPITGATFSPDGNSILTWSFDGSVRLWGIKDDLPLTWTLEPEIPITGATFSPDGNLILTLNRDGSARLWHTKDGSLAAQPLEPDKSETPISGAIFSPNGNLILTLNSDGSARLWDLKSDPPATQPLEPSNPILGAIFSPDENLILTWSNNSEARLWYTNDGSPATYSMRQKSPISGATFSPDGNLILTWSGDGTVRLWAMKNDSPLTWPLGSTPPVGGAIFSPDGGLILTWSFDGSARLWDIKDDSLVPRPLGSDPPIWGAIFSPDGDSILTWSFDGSARLWATESDSPIPQPLEPENSITGATFSPDRDLILTWSNDGQIRWWNTKGGLLVPQPLEPEGPIAGATFSPDGDLILTWSNDGQIRWWNTKGGSPDPQPLEPDNPISGAIFSPDGNLILTWSFDGSAQLWNTEDSSPAAQPLKPDSPISGAIFGPDESLILTWSDDGSSRLWHTKDGSLAAQPLKLTPRVSGATFSSDGSSILIWSDDGLVRWDIHADYDFPKEHFPLLVEVATGTIMDEFGNVSVLDPEEWMERKKEYVEIAEKHLKNCQHENANLYLKQKQLWKNQN